MSMWGKHESLLNAPHISVASSDNPWSIWIKPTTKAPECGDTAVCRCLKFIAVCAIRARLGDCDRTQRTRSRSNGDKEGNKSNPFFRLHHALDSSVLPLHPCLQIALPVVCDKSVTSFNVFYNNLNGGRCFGHHSEGWILRYREGENERQNEQMERKSKE